MDDFVSIQIDQVFDLFVGVDFLKAVAVEDVVSVSWDPKDFDEVIEQSKRVDEVISVLNDINLSEVQLLSILCINPVHLEKGVKMIFCRVAVNKTYF